MPLTDPLYEIRGSAGGQGGGIFAREKISKGQLIMSEQPLITLDFFDNQIHWTDSDAAIALPSMTTKLVSSLPLDGAIQSPVDREKNIFYLSDEGRRNHTWKRLAANFCQLRDSNPTKVEDLKGLHGDVDRKDTYRKLWLRRLWQRFSREIPLAPNSAFAHLSSVDATSPIHDGAIFHKLSFVNHCCFPNAELRFRCYPPHVCNAGLFATVDIPRNDEITLYFKEADRMRRLEVSGNNAEDVLGFTCGCEACLGGYKDEATWHERDEWIGRSLEH